MLMPIDALQRASMLQGLYGYMLWPRMRKTTLAHDKHTANTACDAHARTHDEHGGMLTP
jgi:hypothetical protein